jgi:hypothetical protein
MLQLLTEGNIERDPFGYQQPHDIGSICSACAQKIGHSDSHGDKDGSQEHADSDTNEDEDAGRNLFGQRLERSPDERLN